MGNRTGTYVGFDGLGEANPAKSDYCYYSTMQAWSENDHIDFSFVNSHHKASAVRDSSLLETLKQSIRLRLSQSKQIIIIVSNRTRKTGSLLSYEIEQAVDKYELPLIVAYVNYRVVADPEALSGLWPHALKTRLDSGPAKSIHIPFCKNTLLAAIKQFDISNMPQYRIGYYTREKQIELGCLSSAEPFINIKKT